MTLLASAPTLDGIRESVARFYCGESKTLVPTGPDSWKLVSPVSGRDLEGVHVILKRNRYRFEMAE